MITNQETIYIFSIYICVRACVTLNVTLEYTSNDLCEGVNTIENRIYLIGNIDIYWYYLIGNIDIANIDYEVSISLSLVLLHAYFIATYWIWKSMRQVCSRSIWDMNIHDEESAAGLQQVCGRPAADSSSYWKSMRQVCGKTNLHVKKMTVCGRSAADLRQVCRRSMRQAHFFPMGYHVKEYVLINTWWYTFCWETAY